MNNSNEYKNINEVDDNKYKNINEVDDNGGDDNGIEKLKRENESLKEQLQRQLKENQELIEDLLKSASEAGKKNLELTEENKELQKQKRVYREIFLKVYEQNRNCSEIINVLFENEKVARKNEARLKDELNNVHKISFGVYQENEHLKEENERLKEENERLNSELSSVDKINLEVYQDNERLKEENERLREQLEQSEQSGGREKEEGENKKNVLVGKIVYAIFLATVVALLMLDWILGAVLSLSTIATLVVLSLVSRAKSKSTDNQIRIESSQILSNSGINYYNNDQILSNSGINYYNNDQIFNSIVGNSYNAGYPNFGDGYDQVQSQSQSEQISGIFASDSQVNQVNDENVLPLQEEKEAEDFARMLPNVRACREYEQKSILKSILKPKQDDGSKVQFNLL